MNAGPWFRPILLSALALTIPACGSSRPVPQPPLLLLTIGPADLAVQVLEGSPIVTTFSEPVDAASLNAATLSVSTPAGPVAGTRSAVGSTVTFDPSGGWPLGTQIAVSLTTGLRSVAGAGLQQGANWSFVTRVPVWTGPTVLQGSVLFAGQKACVGVNRDGDGVTAWLQDDGTRNNVWGRMFDDVNGWGVPELLETDNGNANSPQVAIAPDGSAVAVWIQHDGTRFNVYANRFAPGSGWTGRVQIDTEDLGDVYSPAVAMDPAGNAMAVWQQEDLINGGSRIWARRFAAGTGWETATPLEPLIPSGSFEPSIVGALDGTFVVGWSIAGGIRSSRFVPASGWTVPTALVGAATGLQQYPHVARDQAGRTMLVWHRFSGTSQDVWYNEADTSGAWAGALAAETDPLDSSQPRAVFDSSGTATAVWALGPDLVASRRAPAGPWDAATTLGLGLNGNVDTHDLAIDATGNAEAIWSATDGSGSGIRSRRYIRGVGWQGTQILGSPPAGGGRVRIALAARGRGIATWEFGGIVYAARLQ